MAGSIISYKVIGAPELIAKFRAINQIAARDLGLIMFRSAQFMVKTAIANCPVITGNLASSIKAGKLGVYSWEVTASSLEGNIPEKNTKEYANFVEEGTSKMAGRWFMKRAFAATEPFTNSQVAILAAKLGAVF